MLDTTKCSIDISFSYYCTIKSKILALGSASPPPEPPIAVLPSCQSHIPYASIITDCAQLSKHTLSHLWDFVFALSLTKNILPLFLIYLVGCLSIFWNWIHMSPPSENLPSSAPIEEFPFSSVQSCSLHPFPLLHFPHCTVSYCLHCHPNYKLFDAAPISLVDTQQYLMNKKVEGGKAQK